MTFWLKIWTWRLFIKVLIVMDYCLLLEVGLWLGGNNHRYRHGYSRGDSNIHLLILLLLIFLSGLWEIFLRTARNMLQFIVKIYRSLVINRFGANMAYFLEVQCTHFNRLISQCRGNGLYLRKIGLNLCHLMLIYC